VYVIQEVYMKRGVAEKGDETDAKTTDFADR
jgi:hypothetical protein